MILLLELPSLACRCLRHLSSAWSSEPSLARPAARFFAPKSWFCSCSSLAAEGFGERLASSSWRLVRAESRSPSLSSSCGGSSPFRSSNPIWDLVGCFGLLRVSSFGERLFPHLVYSSPPPLLFVPNPISGFRMISFSLNFWGLFVPDKLC